MSSSGAVSAGAGSSKAAGLNESVETIKESENSVTATDLVIYLEKKVEANLVDFSGEVTPKCKFYVLKQAETDWTQNPERVVVINCMVQRAVDGYFKKAEDEVDDFD